MFKKSAKSKQFRQKRKSVSSDDDDSETEQVVTTLEEAKEIQKLRKRQHGVSAEELGQVKVAKVEQKAKDDPFKMNTGGFIDMKALKHKVMSGGDAEEEDEQIGKKFAAETNRRDEDADMLKYVEIEMAKRKGFVQEEEEKSKQVSNPEDALYELPEHLKVLSSKKRTEDMLSHQMLSGIPEIDLGIEAKIKNIEETENAKQKIIQERMNKKEKVSDFVPTNMAVNFVQHNRFNIEDNAPKILRQEAVPVPEPVRVGDAERPKTDRESNSEKSDRPANKSEKATDDFHFEKFRKQLRRY